jgi:hypothetical protein
LQIRNYEFLHAYFGMPGSRNDINVCVDHFFFSRLVCGEAPLVEFDLNEGKCTMEYFLEDGIYPQWATFEKPMSKPRGRKEHSLYHYASSS